MVDMQFYKGQFRYQVQNLAVFDRK